MTAHALRSGGYNGKIDLSLQNLPPGCFVICDLSFLSAVGLDAAEFGL